MHDIFYNNEEDFYKEDEYVHRSLLPDQNLVQEFLTGVLNSVYSSGDTGDLDHCLEELCDILGVEFKKRDCVLEIKQSLLGKHLDRQRKQINILNNRAGAND